MVGTHEDSHCNYKFFSFNLRNVALVPYCHFNIQRAICLMKLDPLHAGEPFLLCLVIAQSGLAGGLGGSPPQGLAPWMPARVLENVAPGLIFPRDILGLTSAQMECQQ